MWEWTLDRFDISQLASMWEWLLDRFDISQMILK